DRHAERCRRRAGRGSGRCGGRGDLGGAGGRVGSRGRIMLLLVGLGNPGASYAGNRHNIGFLALDAIVRRHGFGPWRRRFQGELAEGRLGDAPEGARVLALKPMTYMNESGRAVAEACRFYKLAPSSVVVLHDELDLAPGKVKIKVG